ncbi:cytochrome P450 [Haloarcula sp. S1CR25-12]|uniref:Cytochrome P450 n=1 Tax=Haloarcula saliterrae TaxID=2950534 RepID=A0ABU2FG79_9EURY|nr:cytochrome P450 [Haloarcula sp. S1CR25-12]MDS0261248.1 cytochrome P450 [Haloarcula sp. S1CR25-12]
MEQSQRLPNPPDSGVFNALRFVRSPLRFLSVMQSQYRDGVEVSIPAGPSIVVVTNPDLCHEAMDRIADFSRVPASGAAALIAENGLVQTEGDLWRRQREAIAPGFGGGPLETYVDSVGAQAVRLREEWGDAVTAGQTDRNLHRDMTTVTVRAATQALFGTDIGADGASEMHRLAQGAASEFELSVTTITPEWFPDRPSSDAREVAEGLKRMGEEIIATKRSSGGANDTPSDMLDFLLLAEQSGEYPENHLRDQVVSFLIAGHETTALGTTYTQALLSWHPEVRERVRAEARDVIGDDEPGYEHAEQLTYTGQVITEALRLYPPAWAVIRRAQGDQQLGQYVVSDGSLVIMPQWSVHRDERFFDSPTQFDPSRWDDQSPDERGAYFAFASGPHSCIGRGFATMGARVALATLTRDFDLDVPRDELSDLLVTPTLRPGDGVRATVSPVD